VTRVLHITRDFPPRHCGGISTAVGGLVRAQARAGLTLAVVSFDDWRPQVARVTGAPATVETAGGIDVLRLSSPTQVAAARDFARAQHCALLHVHHGMLWEFAAALRDELRVPTIKTVHVVQRQMNALRTTDERTRSLIGQEAALAGADRVVAPSRAAADLLLAAYPQLAGRLRVVAHGIDDSAAARAAAARRADVPLHGPLLAVGRFAELKGTPELFEAVRVVLARVAGAAATIAGGVPANRRAEQRWRERWRRDTPPELQQRVRFTGWLSAAELEKQYASAGALLAASRFETFGLVALEAMLHGVPVAATAAGGVAELIADGETGLLAPAGDVQALAAHATALLTDAELAQRLGRNAAAAVRRSCLWEQVLPSLLAVYAEIG
jgi:glycogen(starch) synthase